MTQLHRSDLGLHRPPLAASAAGRETAASWMDWGLGQRVALAAALAAALWTSVAWALAATP